MLLGVGWPSVAAECIELSAEGGHWWLSAGRPLHPGE